MWWFFFGTCWTAITLALAVGMVVEHGWAAIITGVFPAAGIVFMRQIWRACRRDLSLRIEIKDGLLIYVWIEDGHKMRSSIDPRPVWATENDPG